MSKNEDWVRTGQGQDEINQEQWLENIKWKYTASDLRVTGCVSPVLRVIQELYI